VAPIGMARRTWLLPGQLSAAAVLKRKCTFVPAQIVARRCTSVLLALDEKPRIRVRGPCARVTLRFYTASVGEVADLLSAAQGLFAARNGLTLSAYLVQRTTVTEIRAWSTTTRETEPTSHRRRSPLPLCPTTM